MTEDALECGLRCSTDIIDEDEILVSAAREDTEAVGRLYDKYYSEIVGYIYHCTFDSTHKDYDYEKSNHKISRCGYDNNRSSDLSNNLG